MFAFNLCIDASSPAAFSSDVHHVGLKPGFGCVIVSIHNKLITLLLIVSSDSLKSGHPAGGFVFSKEFGLKIILDIMSGYTYGLTS